MVFRFIVFLIDTTSNYDPVKTTNGETTKRKLVEGDFQKAFSPRYFSTLLKLLWKLSIYKH